MLFTPKLILTNYGEMDFQEYFVKNHFQPRVQSICYQNIDSARLSPHAKKAIEEADVIIICPSNPWLSIFPIIYLPEVIDLIIKKRSSRYFSDNWEQSD